MIDSITTKILSLAMVLILVAACETTPDSQIRKEHIGAVAGAIGGAILGSNVGKGKGNVAAIAAGTLLGGYLGKQIGSSLDKADLAYHQRTSQHALEKTKTNVKSTWRNPDSGVSGSITPTRTYETASGDYCREYTQTITIDGRTEKAHGEACRQPDGSWQIVN